MTFGSSLLSVPMPSDSETFNIHCIRIIIAGLYLAVLLVIVLHHSLSPTLSACSDQDNEEGCRTCSHTETTRQLLMAVLPPTILCIPFASSVVKKKLCINLFPVTASLLIAKNAL